MRPAALDGLLDDPGKLDEPLDQVLLLGSQRFGGLYQTLTWSGWRVAEDARDSRVRVLDVVDRVLLRLLRGQVDVDVDCLVGTPVDEVPARGVDADLVHEVVEEDDVAAPLRDLALFPALDDVHELVEENLDVLGLVAEHLRHDRVPAANAVVVGTEHVDDPVEAAIELVGEVHDVDRRVGRLAASFGGAHEHAVLLLSELRRADPDRSFLLVRVEPLEHFGQPALEGALAAPGVEMHTEALERRLDPLQHRRHGIAFVPRELDDVLAEVSAFGRLLPTPSGIDGGPEELGLSAGVVDVVLALD